jgi:N-methylhydantoinase B
MRSTKRLVRADGTEEAIPSKADRVAVRPGDVLHFDTWGGGGWGDPLERDPALVLRDVARGLVTEAGARRYGVVLSGGRVDEPATLRLRREMAERRGPVKLFDRGFESIEELKSRCQRETGFPPPRAPVFRSDHARAAE